MNCVNAHVCVPYAFPWRLRLFSYSSCPWVFSDQLSLLAPSGQSKRQRSAPQSAFNPAGSFDFYPNDALPAMFLCVEKWKCSEWRRSVYAWLKCDDLYAPRCTDSEALEKYPHRLGYKAAAESWKCIFSFCRWFIIKTVAYPDCTIEAKWLIFHMKYASFQKNNLPNVLYYHWHLSSGLRGSSARSNEQLKLLWFVVFNLKVLLF